MHYGEKVSRQLEVEIVYMKMLSVCVCVCSTEFEFWIVEKKRLIKVYGRDFPKVNGPIKMSVPVTNSFETRVWAPNHRGSSLTGGESAHHHSRPLLNDLICWDFLWWMVRAKKGWEGSGGWMAVLHQCRPKREEKLRPLLFLTWWDGCHPYLPSD